jgi:hypothetical protein
MQAGVTISVLGITASGLARSRLARMLRADAGDTLGGRTGRPGAARAAGSERSRSEITTRVGISGSRLRSAGPSACSAQDQACLGRGTFASFCVTQTRGA